MCIKGIEIDPWKLYHVPDRFKTQEMCDKAVAFNPYTLRFVPDWFVTQQQVKLWHDDDNLHNDDKPIKWYEGYQKRNSQKAKIKEELMPVASHSLRWRDWCVLKDNKKQGETLLA